ncbi:MAG: hypothetical protein KatS3mg026_0082 [Bacteroidia bacterium]|nr:MAG: hypothetical protein KatS3mg026_0082 [Bacteroidia bacterium]
MARVIHCILNNLVYEQRLHKVALTFSKEHEVEVVGVVTPATKVPLSKRPYSTRRLFVPVKRGPLFFLMANVRFFFYLFFRSKWDAVVACDLDILPACWLASVLRRKKLLLDSRELYTQTSLVQRKPFSQKVWLLAERLLYPRVWYILTVSPPIASYFSTRYKKTVWLIYNLPLRRDKFANPRLENRLLLYQGMLHPDRGLEELILALTYVAGWKLWIVGDGPLRPYLEKLASQQGLSQRVQFFGLVPFEVLSGYTEQATLGVSGEVPRSLNHRFALPNKAFDYLQQGIPLLVGEAPLLRALVRHYGCGYIVPSWQPREIAQALEELSRSYPSYAKWVEGARAAARDLHWEKQESCLQTWLRYGLSGKPLPVQSAEEVCSPVAALSQLFYGAMDSECVASR